MSTLVHLFEVVLEASWQSAIVILLILAVRLAMGARIPARFRFLLWMLVLIRLLVPVSFLPPSPVSIQNVAAVDQPVEEIHSVLPHTPQVEYFFGSGQQRPSEVERPVSPSNAAPTPRSIFSQVDWETVAAGVWLTGFVAILGLVACTQFWLWRRLAKNCTPVEGDIADVWKQCCRRLGIKKGPVVRTTPEVTSPALVGWVHPLLLLPQGKVGALSLHDWENVFVHELAHYRRADHWTNALQLIALAVHWFNPMVWFGLRQMRIDRELATDEWALQHLDPERSTAYGETLLKVLDQSAPPSFPATSVGIVEDHVQLRQRLQRIVGFAPQTLVGSLVGLAIVLAVALPVLGREMEKIDLENYPGMTPEQTFLAAAQDGDLPVVRKEVADGVSLEAAMANGDRALTLAADGGYLDVIRFLVSKGAQVNPNVPRPPVTAAWSGGYGNCAEFLLQHGATCPSWVLAAARGDMAGIQKELALPTTDGDHVGHMAENAAVNGQTEAYVLLSNRVHRYPGQTYWQLWQDLVIQVVANGHKGVTQALIDQGQEFNKGSVTRLAGPFDAHPEMRAFMEPKGFSAPPYSKGEQLIDAAGNNNIPRIVRLLKAGADVNYHGESSWTPVLFATCRARKDAVRYLLQHGADPNAVHIKGSNYTGVNLSPDPEIAMLFLEAQKNLKQNVTNNRATIDYSLAMGWTDMVRWFLDHGVDAMHKSDDGRTYLFDAHNPEIAELLIQRGVAVNALARGGETALLSICESWPLQGEADASPETARVLLKHGADPNEADNEGTTPLMAARNGAMVDVLVEGGANLNAKTKQGLKVINPPVYQADSSRLEALFRHGVPFDPKTDGPSMMVGAAWDNQADLLSILINHGVDPNLKGSSLQGISAVPLDAAAMRGQYEAAKFLVEHGAAVTDQAMYDALNGRRIPVVKLLWDHGNRSIPELTYAVSQNHPVDEIQKLLDAGSPVDPPGKNVQPLALAAELGELDVVKLLVARGAQIDHQPSPALFAAAQEGQDEVVAYLLKNGAKPNKNTLWFTELNSHPLEGQRTKDHFEKTIRLLLDAGVAKGLTENETCGIVSGAVFTRYQGGNVTVLKMLRAIGLNLNARDSHGKTTLDIVHENPEPYRWAPPTQEVVSYLEAAKQDPGK